MMRTTRVAGSSIRGINEGRKQLHGQFATMNGWQDGQNERFDDYVKTMRKKESFESFDQRVERGYQLAVKMHNAEVWNGAKRRLKSTGERFTPDTLREVKDQIEERTHWLRDVWAQIDADYRSGDTERQERAAREISLAMRGEAGDFMPWAYDQKLQHRFSGPQGKQELEAVIEDAELPPMTNEEVNRFNNLKLDMTELEREVVDKYGAAGAAHWEELQIAKDREYEEKLERARIKYRQLLDQQNQYDSAVEALKNQQDNHRVAAAQIRFKTALELEQERERLREAHNVMQRERANAAKQTRAAQLQEASKLRMAGKSSEDIIAALRERNLNTQIQESDSRIQRERKEILSQKQEYLQLIKSLRDGAERREGESLLGYRHSRGTALDEADLGEGQLSAASSSQRSPTEWERAKDLAEQAQQKSVASQEAKKKLWALVKGDGGWRDDPFHVVHQARMDAMSTHDDIYAKTLPQNMNPREKAFRGDGMLAAGNHQDRFIMQDVYSMGIAMQWGNTKTHKLDLTKDREYVFGDTNIHVRDPKTGDVDWRYEKKGGGPVFTGPRFYKAGVEYDKRRPQERPVYQPPAHSSRHKPVPGPKARAAIEQFDAVMRESNGRITPQGQ